MTVYEESSISKERVLIKIASTWEGTQITCQVERDEQIYCSVTLLFGSGQAVTCAEAGATLISPFVGRILDWDKARPENKDGQKLVPRALRKSLTTTSKARLQGHVHGCFFQNRRNHCPWRCQLLHHLSKAS